MVVVLLTPVLLATSPLYLEFAPNTYSHETQTTVGAQLAQSTTTATGTTHNTTMPTVGTATVPPDGQGGGTDSDLGGGDSTVQDGDAD